MTVRLGLVGTGVSTIRLSSIKVNSRSSLTQIFARNAHLPAINAQPDLELVSVFNRSKDKAVDFAQHAGLPADAVAESLEELLANPNVDAIDALLPVQYNLSTIKKIIEAGKPVCIEKPIAASLEDAKEIVRFSRTTDLPILVLENFVYYEGVAKVKELLPQIGDVVTFIYQSTGTFNDKNPYMATTWRLKPEHVGGMLSDGGVHQVAVLTEILGQVDSISGRTTQVREINGDVDTLSTLITMKSGAFGSFVYTSALGATKKTSVFTIFGTKGSIVYDFSPIPDRSPTVTLTVGENASSSTDPVVFTMEQEKMNGVFAEFGNFSNAVQSKDKSLLRVPISKAFHHFAFIVAAVQSAQKNGEVVKVETA